MLSNLKIGVRLTMIVIAMIIGMTAIASFGLSNLHKNLILDRQAKTKNLVEAARNVVKIYFEKVKKNELSEKEAQERALRTIDSMDYGDGA